MKTNANVMTEIALGSFLGMADGVPNQEYHASPYLSSSGLSRIHQSPSHFQEYKASGIETTSAMNLGSAIHAMTLEGGAGVLLAPGSTRSTNLYKDFAKANQGAILLLEDEHERASRATESVLKHPMAKLLLSKGKAEQSAFWIDPETKVLCKCRPDFLRDDGVVIDLKTTQDGSSSEFQYNIGKRKYHWQSAWYLDGLSHVLGKKLTDFVHLVVETNAPYAVSVYALDDAALEKAREDIRGILKTYAECLHTGEWPGYSSAIQNMSLRSWEFQS